MLEKEQYKKEDFIYKWNHNTILMNTHNYVPFNNSNVGKDERIHIPSKITNGSSAAVLSSSLVMSLFLLVHILHKNVSIFTISIFLIIILINFIWSISNWILDLNQEIVNDSINIAIYQKNFLMAFMLFIYAESLFFATFFWAYLSNLFLPGIFVGRTLPYNSMISYLDLPLANTIILFLSGISITIFSYYFLIFIYFNPTIYNNIIKKHVKYYT